MNYFAITYLLAVYFRLIFSQGSVKTVCVVDTIPMNIPSS